MMLTGKAMNDAVRKDMSASGQHFNGQESGCRIGCSQFFQRLAGITECLPVDAHFLHHTQVQAAHLAI